jgi:hypothetical protein
MQDGARHSSQGSILFEHFRLKGETMIVVRRTWKTKEGCRAEVIKLLKAAVEETGLTPRVCTYVDGPQDIVTSYLEFETDEDRLQWRDSIDFSRPASVEWHEKGPDLTESYCKEILQVH